MQVTDDWLQPRTPTAAEVRLDKNGCTVEGDTGCALYLGIYLGMCSPYMAAPGR